MARGRRPRSDAAPTRALEVQRAFRERRRKYIADLENTVRELRQENARLRELLTLQQPSTTQVAAAQLYERPDGPLVNLVDGGAAGDAPLNGATGIPIQVAEIVPGDADGRVVERTHDAPAFYELHAPLAGAGAAGDQRIFRHGVVSFPSASAAGLDPAPNHAQLPPPPTQNSSSLAPADVPHGERAFPSSSLTPSRFQPAGQAVANGSTHGYVRLPRPYTASYVNATGRLVFVPDESTGYPLTLGLSQALPDGHDDKPRLLAAGQTVSQAQAQSTSSSLNSHWPNNHSPTGFVANGSGQGAGPDPHTANSSPATYPHAHFPPPPPPAPVPAFPSVSREAAPDSRTAPSSLSPHPAPPAFWSPFPSQPEPAFPPPSNSNHTTHHS